MSVKSKSAVAPKGFRRRLVAACFSAAFYGTSLGLPSALFLPVQAAAQSRPPPNYRPPKTVQPARTPMVAQPARSAKGAPLNTNAGAGSRAQAMGRNAQVAGSGGNGRPPAGRSGKAANDNYPNIIASRRPPTNAKAPKNFIPPAQPPAYPPPSAKIPPGHHIRTQLPGGQYKNGSWRQYNERNQPVDPRTGNPPVAAPGKKLTKPQAESMTHVEFPKPPKR